MNNRIKPEWIPSAYQKASQPESITIPAIGTLNYCCENCKAFWFGILDSIVNGSKVELTIDTLNGQSPTELQVKSIEEVINNILQYTNLLYSHLNVAYGDLSLDEIKNMYFLAAIEIKNNHNELWFTLEAMPHVFSIYDGFKRFTVIDKEIVWSNV